jgi:ABC-2 type transport system ATP-binding protein
MREKGKQEATVPHRAGMTGSPAIELQALCKAFGTLQAVDHLTLSVEQGEIFGLLRPNGSGKTTTINLISGLSTPSSGEVQVMGYEMPRHARSIRQMLGAVPQETALYEELSAWDNLDFHAEEIGMPRRGKKAWIMQMLDLVQLQERKRSRVSTFSGGMKRRLALARALLQDPQLLYLDETTLGVDVQSRRAIWDYILEVRDQGKTVLITTNYLEEAQALCERIAILDDGKLIAVDSPEHLKQTYGGSVVELETAQPSTVVDEIRALSGVMEVVQEGTHMQITTEAGSLVVPQIITLVTGQGELRQIAVREPNLDEIFLRLLNVLFLMSLLVISGGLAPTAVVMQDSGPLAQQFYTSMSQAHSFVLQQATTQEANTLIERGKIAALVTIPADFDARIRQQLPVQVRVKINNLNTDFTNDIRRAVPDAITQFYQQQRGKSPIKVSLLSAGLGVTLGALLQRIQPVSSAAIVIALYLFFLTGGTAVLAFDPGWLQTIATFVPLYMGGMLWRQRFSIIRPTSLAGMSRCWQVRPCWLSSWALWQCAEVWPISETQMAVDSDRMGSRDLFVV